MSRSRRPIKPALEAETLLQEMEIEALPVNPFMIAERLDITLMPMRSDKPGASGMLMHADGQFGIGYPTHIENEGFKRFSVSHELGHYRLPGHMEAVMDANGQHFSQAGFVADDDCEREADHFAAALLMPSRPFGEELERAGQGLGAMERLAAICQTSLEATAIRSVDCAREPLAVIRSKGKTIDYAFMSSALRDFPELDWIRKGTPVPPETVTADFNAEPANIAQASRTDGVSALQDWFGGPHQQEISEEVVGLGRYGRVLTILSDMEAPDEVDLDEEDLEEAWTPRFKR